MERPALPRDPAGSEKVKTVKLQEKRGKKPPEGEARPIWTPELQEERRMQVFF